MVLFFRIPKKKKVSDAGALEQKSVLASREDQLASKKPSGYAPRTPDQKRETNRHRKDRDSKVVNRNRSQRGNEGRNNDYSQTDWGGGSCSPPDQGHDMDSTCDYSPAPYSPGEGRIGNGNQESEKNAHSLTFQQMTKANSSEVQAPPPPPVIECWEKLTELIRDFENSSRGKSPANLELGSNFVSIKKCDTLVDSSDLGSTTKKSDLTSKCEREVTSTAEQNNSDIIPVASYKREIEPVSSGLQPKRLVSSEYTAEGKGVENDFSHLDKRQKTKLYEKKKKLYYEAKKKYYNEKGNVENNEKKQIRFKEYEKRREDYYNMKWYLYEEKKREHIERKKGIKEKEEIIIAKEAAEKVTDKTDIILDEAENATDETENIMDEPEKATDETENIVDEPERARDEVNSLRSETKNVEPNVNKAYEIDPGENSESKVDKSISNESSKDGDSEMPPLLPPPLPPTELIALAPQNMQQGNEFLGHKSESLQLIGSNNDRVTEKEENSDMDLDSDMELATSESSDEENNEELNLLARFGVDVKELHVDSSIKHKTNIQHNQEVPVCDSSSSLRNIVNKLMNCVSSDAGNANTKSVSENTSCIIDLASSPEVAKTDNNIGTEGNGSHKRSEDSELLGLTSLLKKVAKRIHPTPPPKSSDQHVSEVLPAVTEKEKEKVSKWTTKQFLPLEDLTDPKENLDEPSDLEVVYTRISLPSLRRGSQGVSLSILL